MKRESTSFQIERKYIRYEGKKIKLASVLVIISTLITVTLISQETMKFEFI